MTVEWLRRYNQFLIGEEKSATTIGIHFRTIRAIVNQAKREGMIREADYPFGRGKFEIQEGEGRKMALTLEQIRQIARYDNGSDATALKRSGAYIAYISESLGHSDLKTTENYLASFEKEERQKNAALVADL